MRNITYNFAKFLLTSSLWVLSPQLTISGLKILSELLFEVSIVAVLKSRIVDYTEEANASQRLCGWNRF
jgi:hypothetical protein